MAQKILLATALAFSLVSPSCSAPKGQIATTQRSSGNPFGEVYEIPAAEHDTEDYFGATGIAYGAFVQLGEVQAWALANAQDIVRMKMKHAYKGMVSSYSNMIGNNAGTDIQTKLERGGDQIIDDIVNNTDCSKGPFTSPIDEKGNVTCYVGVRVSKKNVGDKIADYVSNDEELKIRFKEEQFRNRIKEAFKEYKENQ